MKIHYASLSPTKPKPPTYSLPPWGAPSLGIRSVARRQTPIIRTSQVLPPTTTRYGDFFALVLVPSAKTWNKTSWPTHHLFVTWTLQSRKTTVFPYYPKTSKPSRPSPQQSTAAPRKPSSPPKLLVVCWHRKPLSPANANPPSNATVPPSSSSAVASKTVCMRLNGTGNTRNTISSTYTIWRTCRLLDPLKTGFQRKSKPAWRGPPSKNCSGIVTWPGWVTH